LIGVSSKVRTVVLCLIICVAVVGAVSSSTYAGADVSPLTRTPTGQKSFTSSYQPPTTFRTRTFTSPSFTSRTFTSRSFTTRTTRTRTTVTTATTVYTTYSSYPGCWGYDCGYNVYYIYYSPNYSCYVDPNNPYVCYLYLTYPYPSPYPNSLYYSSYFGCYVDPNNPNTCYPYYSTYPNYSNPSPSYPYQTTTTESSVVIQTSYATETTTSTPSPAMVVSTLTNTVTTTDNTATTLYGTLIAVLIVLLGVSVFLLLASRSKTSNPQSYGVAGHYCRNCGNYLNQPDRFCGKCGNQQTP